MTTAQIVFSSTDAAPLFAHYDGQVQPQPAYVTLNLENGEIDADYSGEIGNGMPANVWHGLVCRYRIRNDLDVDQAIEALNDVLPLLQRVLDGSEVVWDESNYVGRLNDDAQDADERLENMAPLGADMDGLVITDLAEWLSASGNDSDWLPSDDDDIEEYIKNFDLDGRVSGEDVGETLAKMWENRLYSGDPLPISVAKFLITDGRCEDSEWTEELAANAEGRIHENQE